MKCRKLKNSIELNDKEKPNLYSAVCMIEALFQDIKDESGSAIKDVPCGDERLPTKLAWLCRIINQIYAANSEDFTRSRDILDEKVAQVKKIEKELDACSEIVIELSAAEAKLADLEEKLDTAHRSRQKYEEISKRCREIESELEALSSIDFGASEARLKELEADRDKATAENAQYINTLTKAENELAELERVNEENRERYDAVCAELEQKKNEAETMGKLINSVGSEIDAIETKKKESAAEKDSLVSKRAVLQRQLEELKAEYESYYSEVIQPLETETGELKSKIEKCEEEKNELNESYKKMKQKHDELIYSIALISSDLESVERSLADKQTLLKEKQQYHAECLNKAESTSGEITELAEELIRLQAEIEAEEKTKLPEARRLVEQSTMRLSELSEQIEKLSRETEELSEKIPQLETELEAKKAVYEALTANYNTKSDEIGALRTKIDELRGKTDEEKHNSYKLQLKSEMDKLNERIRECGELEESIRKLEEELDAAEAEQQRLIDIKSSHELAMQKIEALTKDLKYVAADEYINRVNNVRNQLELLTIADDKLMSTYTLIQNSLDIQFGDESKLEKVKQGIMRMEECVNMLRDSLMNCASCIKMEEK